MTYCLYFPDKKLYISHIEKCGVQSLRKFALMEYGLFNTIRDIWGPKIMQFIKPIPNKIPKDHKFLMITRNPYERIVSGYCSKTVSAARLLPFIHECIKFNNSNENKRFSFRQFIKFLSLKNINNIDTHFKPQVKFVRKSFKNDKNFIMISISNQEKLRSFLKTRGFKTEFPHISHANKKTDKVDAQENLCDKDFLYLKKYKGSSEKPIWTNFYTDDIKAMVFKIYKEDFGFFEIKK